MPRGNPLPKLTTTALEALKRRVGLAAVEQWEEEHGRFTPEEMKEARRRVRAQLRTQQPARCPATCDGTSGS